MTNGGVVMERHVSPVDCDDSRCEPWWLVNGDYVSSSPIDSHAHVKKKGTRERYID